MIGSLNVSKNQHRPLGSVLSLEKKNQKDLESLVELIPLWKERSHTASASWLLRSPEPQVGNYSPVNHFCPATLRPWVADNPDSDCAWSLSRSFTDLPKCILISVVAAGRGAGAQPQDMPALWPPWGQDSALQVNILGREGPAESVISAQERLPCPRAQLIQHMGSQGLFEDLADGIADCHQVHLTPSCKAGWSLFICFPWFYTF